MDDGNRKSRQSMGSQTSSSDSGYNYVNRGSPERSSDVLGWEAHGDNDENLEKERERQIIQPVEPKGAAATSSKYAGRALAEWSMVVNECNSFVDRRRDEGILGLSDVEVPMLEVDGLRRLA